MSADKLEIVAFYGSTRAGRLVERIGQHVQDVIKAQGMEPVLLDPDNLPLEPLKTALHFYPNPADIPSWMDEVNEKIKRAHGFVMIATEYNGGLPAALTNMIDHFPPWSYQSRPVAIINYSMGPFGGARVTPVARAYAAELGMLPVPTTAIIPLAQNVFDEDGTCKYARTEIKIATLVNELKWYATALKNHKAIDELPICKPDWAKGLQ